MCITRCRFPSYLQRNSTLGRCKIGKYMFPSPFANIFLTYQIFVTNLHLLRVELRYKLREKLNRATRPLNFTCRIIVKGIFQLSLIRKNFQKYLRIMWKAIYICFKCCLVLKIFYSKSS